MGGRSVGKTVAQRWGIPLYDKEILEMAAEKSGLSRKYLKRMDETAKLTTTTGIYDVYTTDKPFRSLESMTDQAQTEVMEQIAGTGSCVIVGRRADVVLHGKTSLLRVSVTASPKDCTTRITKRDKIPERITENTNTSNFPHESKIHKIGIMILLTLFVELCQGYFHSYP